MLNRFVDTTLAGVSGAEVKVWLVLYRDTMDGQAKVAHADIARRCGIHPSTVKRALRRLKARGLVEVVYQGGLNRGPSVYRVYGVPRDQDTQSPGPTGGMARPDQGPPR